MKKVFLLLIFSWIVVTINFANAEKIIIAAAADLKYVMDEMILEFKTSNPQDKIEAIYGSSGKFATQIRNGAPYDLYFSADIAYPIQLAKDGYSASAVQTYAFGRIVLWSATLDSTKITLNNLLDPKFNRIAIANPKHAPYGKRAEEALRAISIWDKVKPKLIYGENIAHTAQYVQSGNAQVGIISLSLALNPELAQNGGYWLIPDNLHQPLEQGFIITKLGASNELAQKFAQYINSASARKIFNRYGFVLPNNLN